MTGHDHKRMQELEEKLRAFKEKTAPAKPHQEEKYSQANVGWRMVSELVAGLLIGFGMGYWLDVLLGTKPWCLVVFIFLGLAAGINTMLRTAKELDTTDRADKKANERAKNGE